MFARAASIIRASSNMDGVVILDASVAASRQRYQNEPDHTTEGDSSAESSLSKTSSEDDAQPWPDKAKTYASKQSYLKKSKKTCQILGFATPEQSGTAGDLPSSELKAFLESDLTRLLERCPFGKVVNFTAEGETTSSTEDSESGTSGASVVEDQGSDGRQTKGKPISKRTRRSDKAIHDYLPRSRSVAFMPFWVSLKNYKYHMKHANFTRDLQDYERSRWFAGCLCWSNKADRLLSPHVDLAYLKVFGNSIMTELARLDGTKTPVQILVLVSRLKVHLRASHVWYN